MSSDRAVPACRTDSLPPLLDGLSAAWMPLDASALTALQIPLPAELSRAVDKRKGAFRAGRACAQAALAALGVPPRTGPEAWPLYGLGRAPIWPANIQGSITHSDRLALVAVARAGGSAGLGLDLEEPVPPGKAAGLSDSIGAADEFALAATALSDTMAFTALFSAKEALYKAIYPAVGRFVSFSEARAVSARPGEIRFDLAPDLARLLPGSGPIRVRVALWHSHVITLCRLERDAA